ncbi:unnamed protein product [Pedinophyceae sp. YPF-701]|nr:unnamed protein product [Pedinophyceae sp. YPF-701]
MAHVDMRMLLRVVLSFATVALVSAQKIRVVGALVEWDKPANGACVDEYRVDAQPTGCINCRTLAPRPIRAQDFSATIAQLTPGVIYVIRVTAWSAEPGTLWPTGASDPSGPRGELEYEVQCIPVDASRFAAPLTWRPRELKVTVAGLTNCQRYTCSVTAINACAQSDPAVVPQFTPRRSFFSLCPLLWGADNTPGELECASVTRTSAGELLCALPQMIGARAETPTFGEARESGLEAAAPMAEEGGGMG